MAELKFKTKAQNLKNLQTKLKKAKVLPLVLTSLEELISNEDKVLQDIQTLKANRLIIRSSSLSEDSMKNSNAGAFLSLANIKADSKDELLKALYEVANSMPSKSDEILVQPMLENITLCGVGFSVDKDNFSPYFCLQYDENGSNSSITDGSSKSAKTYYHYRNYLEFKDIRLQKIIELIKELEVLYDCHFLDVEFAFAIQDDKEELFCLQVRPLVMHEKNNLFHSLPKEALYRFYKRFESLKESRSRVLGDKAIFGVMPDWIHSFLGIPYVDVRLSFNSFISKKLDENIAQKLVNFYLDKLNKNHELHDKIEFNIVYSCYDFNSSKKLEELLNHGFNENEIKRLEFSLLELTNKIINPRSGFYLKDIQKAYKLKERYDGIINSNFSLIDKIYWLIEECKRYGTLPFAGVARAAFVAMQLLNSLVEIDFITKEEKDDFLNSLNTVSKNLSKQTNHLNFHNKDQFLKDFGHLRAGTYNILSPRYDEDFELYFDVDQKDSKVYLQDKAFVFSEEKTKALNALLREHGLEISACEFFDFLKQAIEGRELVKFEFTRLLSKAIVYIEELGKYYGIEKEDLAHLDIKSILNLYSSLYSINPKEQFVEEINRNKKEYELTQAIKLPSLLCNADEIFSFYNHSIIPNFITQKSITAFTAKENDKDLEGKIVLIYAADPGYDYLFTKNIAGLITCYGGANSHMAIRASELGMPAVIGVGEENFEKYLKAKKINIECESEQIFCL